MHLEHVNLTVTDLDRSVAFYSDLLDLQLRWKGEIGGGLQGAHIGDDRSYLALFEADEAGPVRRDYDHPGFNHVGFVVDDLAAARQRLQDLGATVHMEADYEPGERIYTTDPDGHEVELVAY
jgi:catechol 2,3-dioxygenase-like lactoylglutathione lyase family enzyme